VSKFAALFLTALSAALFCFSTLSKVYVVSDIDDTIKKANSANGGIPQAYHFFRKKIYPEMRDLFVELKAAYEIQGEEVEFIYVSAAPDILFNQQKWIAKHDFPAGVAILRDFGSGDTYTYKMATIKAMLKGADASDSVYFFGDNASKDAIVYSDVVKDMGLINSFIYIRDVTTRATYWSDDLDVRAMEGVNYFFSERDFLANRSGGLFFISETLREEIKKAYNEKVLIPEYTLKELKSRIKDDWGCGFKRGCKKIAKEFAHMFWNDYHERY